MTPAERVEDNGTIQEPLEALLSKPETVAYAHLGGVAMRSEDYDPGGCTPGGNVQRRER